jgi:hypothetical protein
MLDRVDLLLEAVSVVVGVDRDRLLGDDRPVVDLFVDQVHRDARDLRAPRERLLDRAQTRERGEQRGVQVEDPTVERPDHLGPEHPEVPGEDDVPDTTRLEVREQGGIEVRGLGVLDRVEEDRRDPALASALERPRRLTIGHDEHDPWGDDIVVEQRLEVRPLPRRQDRDPRLIHPSTLWRAVNAVNRRSRKLACVPVEERGVRAGERCSLHPGSASVARCDGCGRPLCIVCAVPVRGHVYGNECLADALGTDVVPDGAPSAEPSRSRLGWISVGFGVAIIGVALPWSRFGLGSDPLGALGRQPRWSWLVAGAAAAGLLWSFLEPRLPVERPAAFITLVLASLVVVGSALSIGRPPPFTRTWLGPWIAAGGGAVALIAQLLTQTMAARRRSDGSIEPS